jgi:hypothetical protein
VSVGHGLVGGLEGLETIAIGDPIGPAPGIEQHPADRPALPLVLGGGHPHRPHVHGVRIAS